VKLIVEVNHDGDGIDLCDITGMLMEIPYISAVSVDELKVTHSVAWPNDNEQLQEAIKKGLPVLGLCGVEWVPTLSMDETNHLPYCHDCVALLKDAFRTTVHLLDNMESIFDMVLQKAAGRGITEEESAAVKSYFSRHYTTEEEAEKDEMAIIFHEEFNEWCEDKEQ
jgi:hypothetical protein